MDQTGDKPPAERLERYSIEKLSFDYQLVNILKNARIGTVGDLIRMENDHGLLRVRNLGKKHYLAIQSALARLGIAPNGAPLVKEPEAPAETVEAKSVPAVKTSTSELKTVVFVDFEHWYVALKNVHSRRPNIQAWFDDLRTRGRLLEVTFFGDFSDEGGMRDQLDSIRRLCNRIVETKNTSPHVKASFTDFIMLDNIYQKIISSPDVEQVILFTGDGDFCSVASYLRNFCGKVVGVYGVDGAISTQLEAISNWCVRLPFSNEPYEACRTAILKNLRYAESHTKSPTFRPTVRLVAEHYDLQEDAVEAELRRMLDEGLIYTVPERSRRNYTMIINVLHEKWELTKDIDL